MDKYKRKPKKGEHFKAGESPAENYDKDKPIFSLRHMRRGDDYCISKCDSEDKSSFADTLLQISQFTWAQLKSISRHKNGFELLPQDAIRKVPPVVMSPDQRYMAFRFRGMKSMVGYRDNDVYHILWLDRDRTLYNHG